MRSTPWRWIGLGCCGVILLAVGLHHWLGAVDEPIVLRPPPDTPPLTEGEFRTLSDPDLLNRINADALRRVIAGGEGWLSGSRVLVPAQCHVWTISVLEPTIMQLGFAGTVSMQAAPTPQVPELRDLALAYEALGMPGPAQVVADAERGTSEELGDAAAMGRLDRRFHEALSRADSMAKRIAFARQHQAELLSPRAKP